MVNSLDGSVDTSAAAETQPAGSGTTLACRDNLLLGLKERTIAAVETGIWGIPAQGEAAMRRCLALSCVSLLLALVASAAAADERSVFSVRAFVGLWEGIDPVDGGDVLHSITCFRDGTCQLVVADRVVTLCGGGSGVLGGTGALEGDELVFPDVVLTCADGRTLDLEIRYERDQRNRTLLAMAVVGGTPFRSIVLHKVSR